MTLSINISQQHPRPAPILSENEFVPTQSNNTYSIMSPSSTENDPEEEEEEEDIILGEEDDSSSSSSSIPDENINFDLVYALHTFSATVEGQASVFKGDALILMEDTNIYWWLVEVLKTQEIGYIPAENIETPYERLARLNKHRNVDITTPFPEDNLSAEYTIFSNVAKKVTIADDDCLENVTFFEVESDLELDDDNDDELSIDYDNNHDNGEDEINDEHLEDFEQDMVLSQHEEQQNDIAIESLAREDSSDDPNEIATPTANEQLQKKSRISQQRRPQRYLSPDHFKHDVSSHYLPGEGNSFKRHSAETHHLRVFAGNIGQGPLFHSFDILATTTTEHLLKDVVQRFNLTDMGTRDRYSTAEYYITVQGTDGDEYILAPQDKPCSIFKTLTASLTTPMPAVSQNIFRKPQEGNRVTQRKRSSSFGKHEQTSYEEDSVIRFYIHRRIKHAHHEKQGVIYIKVSLYPDEYVSSSSSDFSLASGIPSTFLNNNSSSSNKKKTISTRTTGSIKTEIDRIDKILSVSYDTMVGSVISTALEKFHIPDTELAEDRHPSQLFDSQLQQPSQKTSTASKYVMSIRNGNGQETKLSTTDCIADVLHEQQQQRSHRTSNSNDCFFILRRCQPAKQNPSSSFGFSSLSKKNRKISQASSIGASIGNMISGGGHASSGTRRPSILDILLDSSPPPSANDRQPNSNNNKDSNHSLAAASSKNMDRRCKGDQQNRSGSLNILANGQCPAMTISSERQSSCPDLAINGDQASNSNKPHQTQPYNNTTATAAAANDSNKKRREGSSSTLKQQLKRLVTWGSSSSFKVKKVHDLTISTSVSSTSSFKSSSKSSTHSQQQQQQQQQVLPTPTTLVSTSMSKLEKDTKPIPTVTRVAVKSQYLRQQHEPSDKQRRRQDMPPSLKTNLDSMVSEASLSTTTSSCANSSSESTSKQRSPTIYQHHDTSISSSNSSDDDDEPTTLRDDDPTMTATPVGIKDLEQQRCLTVNRDRSGQSVVCDDNNTNNNHDTVTAMAAQQQQQQQDDEFVDSDLFYLVTQGVDFLKTREGTKWEEDGEENGYQYHPWNWSSPSMMASSDTLATTQQGSSNENCEKTPSSPASPPPISTMDKSLVSPPLSPLATITQLKRPHSTNQEEEKSRMALSSVMTPKESPVDDEELQWIVNSHILF